MTDDNIIHIGKWKLEDKALARLDRGELSSLLTHQADELAQLLNKATEAARRMSAVQMELATKKGVEVHQAQAYALFSAPLLDHLIASHDLAWNLVMLARDISKDQD